MKLLEILHKPYTDPQKPELVAIVGFKVGMKLSQTAFQKA